VARLAEVSPTELDWYADLRGRLAWIATAAPDKHDRLQAAL
jgi:hypothetical protein